MFYKVNEKYEVEFGASLFVIELNSSILSYLDVIKVNLLGIGYGSHFIIELYNMPKNGHKPLFVGQIDY
jgi:hypothetical protein